LLCAQSPSGGGAGDIPPLEAWPEIWVDAQDKDIAARLIEEILSPQAPAPDAWICPDCGEHIEGQFAECWRCSGTPE